MFEYVTAQEAAELWGISARRVQRLCKENRIEDVLNINRVWLMPINIKAKLAFLVYPILIWRALIRILKRLLIFMKSSKMCSTLYVSKSRKEMNTMDFILKTTNLCKSFGKHSAVTDVSIHVRENSVYGLLGPNGAGKSTILKMVTGMLHPTKGTIEFANHSWSRQDLMHIGALIENPPLYENLTAFENLKVRTILLGLPEQRINDVLKIVDLQNTGKKKAGQFSMGMKQRLGIAIALLNHPSLLILDEPTNGLDPIGIGELRNLIRSFPQQGITVILSSHILSEVQLIADDIGIIANGTLGYEGEMQHSGNLEELFLKVVEESRR